MENKKEKSILIATFIPKNKVDWFFKYINKKFSVNKECIYIYEIENNELDYLLTFKMVNDKRVDFKFHFDNATIVNVDHSKHEINWSEYRDKLVLCNKNNLSIKKIKKIVVEINKN